MATDLSAIPLFPLPNAVLFPRAVLPLHIFEDRYKQMTADVLKGSRHLAMALLKPGWERDYYGTPEIEPIVCVGEILTSEKLEDGKYNFLLQGKLRARVVREVQTRPYRIAELEPLRESELLEIDLEQERRSLIRLFSAGALATMPVARQFRDLLTSALNTPDIGDLAAFNLLDDIPTKQQLLADPDVRRRLSRLVTELSAISAKMSPGLRGFPSDPSSN